MSTLTKTPKHNRSDRTRSSRVDAATIANGSKSYHDETGAEEQLALSLSKTEAFANLRAKPTPIWKRLVDCLVAGSLLVLLAPLLVLIAIFIRIVSKGPVFFTQSRLGLMGEEFTIYKFRTLKCSATATADHKEYVANLSATDGVLTKPDLSSRMIPGGKLLRQTSLDELPQLINILQGNMSLVGPRPDVMDWADYRSEQLRRFEVVPGVTGYWQVSGKNRLTFDQMIEKDLYYVDHRSCWLDLFILVKTFGLLLHRDNK
jgi:lipopolysaccharide/colanic/teichoic acid biosynthesis glycosyltransferase